MDLMHFGNFTVEFILQQTLGWGIETHKIVVERYAQGPATVPYGDVSGANVNAGRYASGTRTQGKRTENVFNFRDLMRDKTSRAAMMGEVSRLAPKLKRR